MNFLNSHITVSIMATNSGNLSRLLLSCVEEVMNLEEQNKKRRLEKDAVCQLLDQAREALSKEDSRNNQSRMFQDDEVFMKQLW